MYEHNRRHKTSFYVFEDRAENQSILAYHAREFKKNQKKSKTRGHQIGRFSLNTIIIKIKYFQYHGVTYNKQNL